jgi:predicted enzyme involved in methoxymalonyl-ACP biosynthesis
MNYLDYSKELNAFSFNAKEIDPLSLKIDADTLLRIRIRTLYYALYHRVLSELPKLQSSTTPNQHQQIEDQLYKKSPSSEHTRRVYQHFKELKALRIWADYRVNKSLNITNIAILLAKTNSFINSKQIF